MSHQQRYPLAVHSWNPGSVPLLVRCQRTNELVASFPLEFVKRSGNDSWRYILDVVNQLVEPSPGHKPIIRDGAGVAVELSMSTAEGVYWFEQSGSSNGVTMSRGPEYFSSRVPPSAEGSVSTRSNSKRSSANQSRFREYLIARDCSCLVTDVVFTSCTASHIVPFSRPDIYQQILHIPYEPPMFEPSVGLLLRDDLHHAYDQLQWSLYYKDGVFFVHFFLLKYPDALHLHGKAIPPHRFRGDECWRPDIRLIQWHYNQCVKAHIRGFAVGF